MRYYLLVFIIYEIAIGFYFYREYADKMHHNHQNTIKLVGHTLDTAVNTFELANDDFHSQYVYKLSKSVNRANGASIAERSKVREELLQALMGAFYCSFIQWENMIKL